MVYIHINMLRLSVRAICLPYTGTDLMKMYCCGIYLNYFSTSLEFCVTQAYLEEHAPT